MTQSAVAAHFTGVGGGLVMSLIAFSIVFIVIMGLMFIMMGMKHVCRAIDGCKKAPVSAPAAPSAPASPAAKAVAVPAVGDDGELLAVISAAIAAMCGSAARVVSFAPAKAPAGSSWKFIGRIQNAEGFQD
ncbi:MAG: OadG family protein [Synergistaceae bacterium]|jgi:sodium pump decarboxylase gamma subunit|nr:OadG family protein [Synergistaceae bacterium]MBP9559560.1 OadG family protein [Synergistaceae bacterium]PKL03924.1 MAG: sodium pump decarboxylase subunit gamma [Synergistetes bacterium HGW-Synergistetes-1]